MACRCSEIRKCAQDIALLSGDIASKLKNAQDSNNTAVTIPAALVNSLSEAVSIDNMARISQSFASMRKQQESLMDDLIAKRADEFAKVDNRMTRLEGEDRRFHEMQARLQLEAEKEAQRRAQLEAEKEAQRQAQRTGSPARC